MECMGCALANGSLVPVGGIIKETEHFILHQDVEVPIKGFLVIASKRHIKSVADMAKDEAVEFMELLYDARKALLSVEGIIECTFIQEERSGHFHFWLFPRYEWMDGLFKNSLTTVREIMKYAEENMNTAENIKDIEINSECMKENLVNT